MKEITRKQKILMYLNEYYFGFRFTIRLLRLIGGPLIIAIGLYFFGEDNPDKMATTYATICFLYGIYYTIKPYLWILFRWKPFGPTMMTLVIDDDKMIIREEMASSEIRFDYFKQVIDRGWYFSFLLKSGQKIYLPKHILSKDQMVTIAKHVK